MVKNAVAAKACCANKQWGIGRSAVSPPSRFGVETPETPPRQRLPRIMSREHGFTPVPTTTFGRDQGLNMLMPTAQESFSMLLSTAFARRECKTARLQRQKTETPTRTVDRWSLPFRGSRFRSCQGTGSIIVQAAGRPPTRVNGYQLSRLAESRRSFVHRLTVGGWRSTRT